MAYTKTCEIFRQFMNHNHYEKICDKPDELQDYLSGQCPKDLSDQTAEVNIMINKCAKQEEIKKMIEKYIQIRNPTFKYFDCEVDGLESIIIDRTTGTKTFF